MSGAPDVGGSLGASAQPAGTPRGRAPGRPAGQVASGLALGVGLPAAVTFAAQLNGDWLGLPATTLALLLAMVLATLVGGLVSALVSALVGSALLNYFFIPPYHSLAIGEPHNVLTVGLFVGVGVIVSAVVNRAAREASEATRASAEARTLAALADSALQGAEALPTMLEQARASFGMTSAALLSRRNAGEGAWLVLGSVGPEAPTTPALADVCVDAGPGQRLALAGRTLGASDQLVLRAFAAQAASLLERDRLARAAEAAERLKATDRLRESLLLAVGHDLRRPLASASAAVESLRNPQIGWSDAERAELLATADDSLRRLAGIVDDLLDLSRLQTGALKPNADDVWLDEVVPPALDELGDAGREVRIDIPDTVPPVRADAGLVKRIVSNLAGNALTHGRSGVPPTVSAAATPRGVELRVADHGPGLDAEQRARPFAAFQHAGDADASRTGLGLGLAVSKGLAEAMGGTLVARSTPGGGATLVLTLPMADAGPTGPGTPGQREREDG